MISVSYMINIRADGFIRGIDRSEGAKSSTHSRCDAALETTAHSEGKSSELKKHGCIKEFSYTCDDAVRRTALDPSDGSRADA